uniref:NXPE C-terminal domain-containing protein n=1 Tax=Labrus bergylta TaxID=56723 RepID=A0A3Q3FCB4_9LABR
MKSNYNQCLKGKVVHMYGDSTVRQWFEYFDNSPKQTGPYMIWDNAKNILVTYRVHGPPLSFIYVPTSELRYIANEIDGLVGGTNTVVVFSVWAHFSPFPIELYIRRLQSIRRAVIRLLNRAPDTLVVIRTANLRGLTPSESLNYSDWYTLQLDKVLRAVFKGFNVRLVDAWEMTLAHHLPHNIHPGRPIVKNMIDILLSYICTK